MNNLIIKNPYVPNGGLIDRRGFSTESNFYGSPFIASVVRIENKKAETKEAPGSPRLDLRQTLFRFFRWGDNLCVPIICYLQPYL